MNTDVQKPKRPYLEFRGKSYEVSQEIIPGSSALATASFLQEQLLRFDPAMLQNQDPTSPDATIQLLDGTLPEVGVIFNKSKSSKFQSDMCLPDLLMQQAETRPNAIAVLGKEGSLTFSQLATSSHHLAAYLRRLDVGPDSCVGIFVEPSLELTIGVWGTLFAGGAYLPLSPEYPEKRLRYMTYDAKIKVVFTQDKLRKKLSDLAPMGTRVVTLDDVAKFRKSELVPVASCQVDLSPDNLAYIIYTSGSTGNPKGVMIEHGSIVSQMQYLNEEFELDKTKRVLQKTPMSFDAAQWEILAPACGSTVIMGYPGIYRDVKGLTEMIQHYKVTTLQCVPTLLRALMDTDDIAKCRSLTEIFCGGEPLSRQLAKLCYKKLPNCRLVNLYGPTECTINASTFVVDLKDDGEDSNSVSIGKPVKGTQFYVMDNNRNLVPRGELGELYIGGIQVARGYLFKPDLTAEKFIDDPSLSSGRLYRTGDLVCYSHDGTYQCAGRVDNQVKVNGHRIELDEVRLAIERHGWVKNAAVLVMKHANTDADQLIAYVELSPKQAVLMDQGNHGAHHQSKKSRLQVKAQLSNMGCREVTAIRQDDVISLPGKEATKEQRKLVFARKTYRFYEGEPVTKEDLVCLLQSLERGSSRTVPSRDPSTLSMNELGTILRYFGQFNSDERLLPKYGYASPGALYATQMYLEIANGYYYYHPIEHKLFRVQRDPETAPGRIKVHFVGKRQAIEPVYKNNIQEVLEMETGHMLGLFDAILPSYGLCIGNPECRPDVIDRLNCNSDDYYLGCFEMVPHIKSNWDSSLDLYVQAHQGKIHGMPAGQYRYENGQLIKISDDVIQKNHVIAINQRVYERASFGITTVCKTNDWLTFIRLGRKLQQLQMNQLRFGFMSSGYSSKTGNNLPAATRISEILAASGAQAGPCYFAVGGLVSEDQWLSEGMKEDTVHMQGPAEMIKEDLKTMLPKFMIPKRLVILDKLPETANGKIDLNVLKALKQTTASDRPFIAARTATEERISQIWMEALKLGTLSVVDDFFEIGGDSMSAVRLIHEIRAEFKKNLPLQVLFEAKTVELLARIVDSDRECDSSRLIPLYKEVKVQQRPIYCWPGLGGYPMNLRLLGTRLKMHRTFYGVQAHGINEAEVPYETIKTMAAADIEQVRCVQPRGPYTLWGYSFGARVAFEVACQLEQAGETVDNLFLIAPGSPKLDGIDRCLRESEASFENVHFVTMLFSVFAATIDGPLFKECLACANDEETFVSFISAKMRNLQPDLVQRIVRVVRQTYEFEYTFSELAERRLRAPITIFEARGDDYSFINEWTKQEKGSAGVIALEADHYSLLKEVGVDELIAKIRERLGMERRD